MRNQTLELFPDTKPPRAKPRKMAHIIDGGPDAVMFECSCGWNSDWAHNNFTYTEIKRGIPCERCN